jgi:hypothetical protein
MNLSEQLQYIPDEEPLRGEYLAFIQKAFGEIQEGSSATEAHNFILADEFNLWSEWFDEKSCKLIADIDRLLTSTPELSAA